MYKTYLMNNHSRVNEKIRMAKTVGFILLLIFSMSCKRNSQQANDILIIDSLLKINRHLLQDSLRQAEPEKVDSVIAPNSNTKSNEMPPSLLLVNTGATTAGELMKFAETLVGIPYVWASTDPRVGFDCSGFITYVFMHFGIQVPRSSIDFTNVGKTVPVGKAKRGDIILFTGTNSLEPAIGHMGLVVSNDHEGLQFIHATSGKAMSVTITRLNDQYKKRFIRITRVFRKND